jgi:hypothetical protein
MKRPSKEKSITKTIRMTELLSEQAHAQAEKEHRTFAALVNVAVIKYLESQGAL